MLLEGKTVLITGAARGIGAQCARTFAQQGAKALILLDINEEAGKSVVGEIGGKCRCEFIKTDITDEQQAYDIFNHIRKDYGRLDILLNIAGIGSTVTMFDMDLKTWDRIMDINLKGAFIYGREALKIMMEQQYGRIVSMASIAGQVGGIRTSPAYAASKAGIICLTKSFAKAGAKSQVTVNCLAPGLVDTDMTRDPDFHYDVSEIPMGVVSQPEDIADVALFLASDLSRNVTGQCIHVSGGMYM